MSSGSKSSGEAQPATVSFGERYAASAAFDEIYRDGMALVEAAASYLDGEGRKDAKRLKPALALCYATESMRLTTRLMQLASWLLIRRALNEGELTAEDAANERRKVRLNAVGRPGHVKDYRELPEALQALIEASYALYERVQKLDRMLEGSGLVAPAASTVAGSLEADRARLAAAFGTGRKPG